MTCKNLSKAVAVILVTATVLFAASLHVGNMEIRGGRLFFGTGGLFQLPFGTTLPATCSVGDMFFDTDAPAGQNSYGCTAVNTWTLQGGAGAEPFVLLDEIFGYGGNVGNFNTAIQGPGLFSSTVGPFSSGSIYAGALFFADINGEILYARTKILPAGYNMADVDVYIEANHDAASTATHRFFFQATCLPTDATGTNSPDFTAATYYPTTPINLDWTPESLTSGALDDASWTGLDLTQDSSGCGTGDLTVLKLELDELTGPGGVRLMRWRVEVNPL